MKRFFTNEPVRSRTIETKGTPDGMPLRGIGGGVESAEDPAGPC